MMRILVHPLLLAIVALAILYGIFAYGIMPPVPKSLLIQYMVFCGIGVLLVISFDEATWTRSKAPILALLGDPCLRIPRAVTLVLVVLGVSAFSYSQVKPDLAAPVELRTVHPAPPSTLRVYGKSYDLLKLQNPLRELEGTEAFTEAVAEGGELYYKNCIYCHGDLLDGQGHFGMGFNPRPANFQDVGTIAQLQEAYLFWRITTGAPGLPREGAPWASAMPVWHEMLKEDEVWKIIAFLYDYTGHEPRSWELEASKPIEDGPKSKGAGPLSEEDIQAIYMKRCAHCHGEEGDGLGPAAEFMYPLPRDFTLGTFKFKSTHADDEFPTDDDLRRTINEGLPGTSMPAWKSILTNAEVDGLITLIKQFGEWDEEEIEHRPIAEGTQVTDSPESRARGRESFLKACKECHGLAGRGNITSGKKLKDDWQNRIWPRNLTRPSTWRSAKDVRDVFQRISTGIRGTPMPEHTTNMKEGERWDIANYVMSLRDTAVPVDPGETVLRAVRVDGTLPETHDDPAWDKARPITFQLVPNIIKEPRLYFSLNDRVTVRALFNETDIVFRLDVDDRTYSVPGDPEELKYRLEDGDPTRDALAIQLPLTIPVTSEKPWFRHGDRKHPVNMWYWAAPSVTLKAPETVLMMDAVGPDAAPSPRDDSSALAAKGAWKDGRWQVVFKRAIRTEDDAVDLQFEEGRYIPISFANWDGLAGQKGGRHSFTSWYWLLLEPHENVGLVWSVTGGSGVLSGVIFLLAVDRQRRRRREEEDEAA